MSKIVTFLLVIITVVVSYLFGMGFLSSYIFFDDAPDQPIAFSHKIHAGDKGMPCLYCHIYATKSRVAGVPSVAKCVGCHESIRRDSPEIQKLLGYWERQEPIPWVRVYDAADYIYFPHKRHVKAGVACQDCHGPVQSMDKVKRQQVPGMGWCLTCHNNRTFTAEDGIARNGPIDCWECHQ